MYTWLAFGSSYWEGGLSALLSLKKNKSHATVMKRMWSESFLLDINTFEPSFPWIQTIEINYIRKYEINWHSSYNEIWKLMIFLLLATYFTNCRLFLESLEIGTEDFHINYRLTFHHVQLVRAAQVRMTRWQNSDAPVLTLVAPRG